MGSQRRARNHRRGPLQTLAAPRSGRVLRAHALPRPMGPHLRDVHDPRRPPPRVGVRDSLWADFRVGVGRVRVGQPHTGSGYRAGKDGDKPMTDTLMGTLVGAAVTLLLGVLTWWTGVRVNRAKAREEQKKSQAEEQARIQAYESSLWDRMETRMKEQDTKIQALTERLDQRDKQVRELREDLNITKELLRDRNEVVADFLEHHVATTQWQAAGSPPPPPPASWRIRQAIEQYKAEQRKEVGS